MRPNLSQLRFVLAALFAFPFFGKAETENVVIFFVDDLGWTDLACTGSDFHETPNIDKLAKTGVRFTSGYAACTVCSPTRAALLTGQSPARLHLTDFIAGHPFVNTPMLIPDWQKALKKEHLTLPELLKPHGYATAHIGKWHLAHRDGYSTGNEDNPDPDFYPTQHGFDINIGGCERGAPGSYFWPYGRGKTLEDKKKNSILATLPKSDKPDEEFEGEYLTDRLAGEAETILDRFAESGSPFYLHFSFYNVHTPLMGRPDLVEKYEKKLEENPGLKHTNVKYATMVESVDEAVGRVMAKLDAHELTETTLVIFTSDNGGLKPAATDNSPLRQGKGSIYEGGVRVPLIISDPNRAAKDKLCHVPAITMDLLPTIFESIGKAVPEEALAVQDGISLAPLLDNPRAEITDRNLYWHYPHYHSMGAQPYSAIRSGPWKLIEVIGQDRLELYNLSSDIHENTNLAQAELDKTRELYFKMADWRKSVGAQMPRRNLSYNENAPTGISRNGKLRMAAPIRE